MKNFAQWRSEHEREVAAIERETQERIRQNNLQLDMKLAMIHASEQLYLDELLAGKSTEYKDAFQAGRIFEQEITQVILES